MEQGQESCSWWPASAPGCAFLAGRLAVGGWEGFGGSGQAKTGGGSFCGQRDANFSYLSTKTKFQENDSMLFVSSATVLSGRVSRISPLPGTAKLPKGSLLSRWCLAVCGDKASDTTRALALPSRQHQHPSSVITRHQLLAQLSTP